MKLKKICLTLLPSIAVFVSCSDDSDKDQQLPVNKGYVEVSVDALYSTRHTISQKTAESEAMEAAKRFFSDERSIESTTALKSTNKSAPNMLPDTLAYIVNFSNAKGYALIAADDRSISRVLFCTEQGIYDKEDIKTNLEMYTMIDKSIKSITGDIYNFEHNKQQAKLYCDSKEIKGEGVATSTISTSEGPYMTIKWGQGDIYNALCHKCSKCSDQSSVGCVQLAIAEIMSYYKKPNQLQDGYALHWDKMLAKNRIQNLDSVGRIDLQHLLGYIQKTNHKNIEVYGCEKAHNGTLAYVARDGEVYRAIGYSLEGYLETNSGNTLFSTLESKKHPLVVADDIHAWIADGYKVVVSNTPTIIVDAYGNVQNAAQAIQQKFIHYNWGWQGDSNGYFDLSILHDPDYNQPFMQLSESKIVYDIHPE